jgi:peptidoglycan hydrolase-like protein with peptidoglycan-binding domain
MRGANKKHSRRTGRVVLVATAVFAVGAGAVAAMGIGLPADETSTAGHSILPPATAKVTMQTLVDTQSKTGKLSYGDSISVSGKSTGTVTSVPVPDSVIKKGKELYRVDNTPVILMYGSLPMYRELKVDIVGPDVKQFEQNLWDLGYRGFTVDEKYTGTTATAVEKWQKDLGFPESGRTGAVDEDRVVYAPDAVRVDIVKASLGDSAKPGDTVLLYTGTVRGATVELSMSDQRLAVKDAAVTVTLPDGKAMNGTITRTQTKISEDSGSGQTGADDSADAETKIVVTVSFDDPNVTSGFDQASVDIGFTAAKHENVLTVPVTALLTLTEGGYGVQVVEGETTRIVAVETGMFANGRVEVKGGNVTEGMTVGVPA